MTFHFTVAASVQCVIASAASVSCAKAVHSLYFLLCTWTCSLACLLPSGFGGGVSFGSSVENLLSGLSFVDPYCSSSLFFLGGSQDLESVANSSAASFFVHCVYITVCYWFFSVVLGSKST